MRGIIVLVFAVLALNACKPFGEKANVELQGEGIDGNETYVYLHAYNFTDSVKIEQGSFLIKFHAHQPAYYTLKVGNRSLTLYVSPDQKITIKGGAEPFVSVNGAPSVENEYLKRKKQLQLDQAIPLSHFYDRPVDEFRFLADSLYLTQKILMTSYMEEHSGFSEDFVNKEKDAMFYDWCTRLMEYPQMSTYGKHIDKASYFKFLKDASLNEAAYLSMYDYQSFLLAYFDYFGRQEMLKRGLTHFYPYELAKVKMQLVVKEVMQTEVKDYLLYEFLNDQIRFYGYANTEELFMLFEVQCSNEDYREKILTEYSTYKQLGNSKAPFVALESLNGEFASLEKFEGSYLYIDVWASWCLPCRKESPYFEEMKSTYAHKNVIFLSLSVDKNRTDWEEFIKAKKLYENQYLVTQINDFLEAYHIKTIPHFLLIDPQGNLIDANAKRPSSSNKRWMEELPDKAAV